MQTWDKWAKISQINEPDAGIPSRLTPSETKGRNNEWSWFTPTDWRTDVDARRCRSLHRLENRATLRPLPGIGSPRHTLRNSMAGRRYKTAFFAETRLTRVVIEILR
jgi:hypothetical protein